MKLASVELLRLELELVRPVTTSSERHDSRPILLVRLETDAGVGTGECSALVRPTYTEEYADGAERVLALHLLPRLCALGPELPSVELAMAALGEVRGNNMAKAAIEMALFDLWGVATGRPLSQMIGATRSSVAASATIGAVGVADALFEADRAVAAGYRRLKVKVAPASGTAAAREDSPGKQGSGADAVEAVRAASPEVAIVADLNGALRLGDPMHEELISRLDALGLAALEEPLSPGDLLAYRELRQRLATPIFLDESAGAFPEIDRALELGAADAIVLKPARLGGLERALSALSSCCAAGTPALVGGLFETGVGRAAAIAFAALGDVSLPGDLGASDRYFSPDLTEAHVLDAAGCLAVPGAPGLGVAIDEEVVSRFTVRRHRFAL